MLFAKGQRLAIPVDFVCQNAFWITTIALPIPGYRPLEVFRFIKWLEVQPFDPGISVHQTDVQFWARLGVGVCFPPDDRPNPRLGKTDDAPWDTVDPGLKHTPLLLIDSSDYIQAFCLLRGQFCTFLN